MNADLRADVAAFSTDILRGVAAGLAASVAGLVATAVLLGPGLWAAGYATSDTTRRVPTSLGSTLPDLIDGLIALTLGFGTWVLILGWLPALLIGLVVGAWLGLATAVSRPLDRLSVTVVVAAVTWAVIAYFVAGFEASVSSIGSIDWALAAGATLPALAAGWVWAATACSVLDSERQARRDGNHGESGSTDPG